MYLNQLYAFIIPRYLSSNSKSIQKIPAVNTIDKYKPAVQASAGIVLIFFLTAGTVLCFDLQ